MMPARSHDVDDGEEEKRCERKTQSGSNNLARENITIKATNDK